MTIVIIMLITVTLKKKNNNTLKIFQIEWMLKGKKLLKETTLKSKIETSNQSKKKKLIH